MLALFHSHKTQTLERDWIPSPNWIEHIVVAEVLSRITQQDKLNVLSQLAASTPHHQFYNSHTIMLISQPNLFLVWLNYSWLHYSCKLINYITCVCYGPNGYCSKGDWCISSACVSKTFPSFALFCNYSYLSSLGGLIEFDQWLHCVNSTIYQQPAVRQ